MEDDADDARDGTPQDDMEEDAQRAGTSYDMRSPHDIESSCDVRNLNDI